MRKALCRQVGSPFQVLCQPFNDIFKMEICIYLIVNPKNERHGIVSEGRANLPPFRISTSLSCGLHVELRQDGATVLGHVDVVCVCSRRFKTCYNDVHVGESWGLKRSISAGVVQGVFMLHSSSPDVL
jgi:hypothetical protein